MDLVRGVATFILNVHLIVCAALAYQMQDRAAVITTICTPIKTGDESKKIVGDSLPRVSSSEEGGAFVFLSPFEGDNGFNLLYYCRRCVLQAVPQRMGWMNPHNGPTMVFF
jgi:hypothetical protein